jgi:CHAT domain-containing protein
MVKMPQMNREKISPWLALCALVVTGYIWAAEPPVQLLGHNLVDEHCEARDRDDLSPEAGVQNEQQIYCADKFAGRVAYERYVPGNNLSVEASKTALLLHYARSRIAKAMAVKATCSDAKWIDGLSGRSIALLPCQLKSGGWPHLVLLSSDKKTLTVADGSPTLLPVMLKIGGMDEPHITAIATKEYLQKLWGKPLILASSHDLDRFRQLSLEGRNASNNFDFQQSEATFRKALELQVRLLSPNDPAIAGTLMDLALSVSNQGKAEEAQALYRRAEGIVQTSPFAVDRATLMTYQGFDAANRGDYEAALKIARSATSVWRQLASGNEEQSLLRGDALTNNSAELAQLALALDFEAKMALRNEDIVSAHALASESLLKLNQVPSAPPAWKSDVMTTLGEISIAQGRLSAAETYFNAALTIRKQVFGEGVSTIPVLAALGRAYQSEGMNDSAIITYRSIFKIAQKLPQSTEVISNEQLIPFADALVGYAETLPDNTARQGLYAEAFEAFQLARSSLIDKTIAKAHTRMSQDDPNIAALIEQTQSAQRQLEGARAELAMEQSLSDQERSRIVESRLQKIISDSQRNTATLTSQLASQFPAYHGLTHPKPIDLTEMRKRLGDREALLTFIIGKKKSFIQITKRQGNYVAKIKEGEASLAETVKALRRALEIQGGRVNEFDTTRAHDLYKTLLGGIENQLQGVDHLIVAAKGPLASLPFGLLITQAPKDKNYTTAAWLGQKMAISHVPSMQAFYTLRGNAPKSIPPKVMLAFGDPLLDGPPPLAAGATNSPRPGDECRPAGPMNSKILKALAPLPETSLEIKTIAGILGTGTSSLFLRDEATEINFHKQALKDYRILYFATHGLLPGELKCQTEPGLVFTPPAQQPTTKDQDGLLEASEIATLRLNADMVVLSACNTAGSDGKLGGDALSGLAESFFFAGARSLVASHWQVPSSATAQLMTAMFSTLGPTLKGGTSEALKVAQSRLIAKKETSHPFFWAAFVLIGDGMADTSAQGLKDHENVAGR